VLAAATLAACGSARPGRALATGPPRSLERSRSSHVIVVVMENEENSNVIGSAAAPYANALARRYGLATQSFAIAHPSLPNYLALTGGATHGISSDCTDCHVAAANIVDELQAAKVSWRAYMEDQPTPCFRGSGFAGYAKKHNPFIYYDDVASNPSRCRRIVGFGQLEDDLRSARLPTFAWITPNLCDDGHDCGVAAGDRFLARTVPLLLRELGPHGLLVLTWDEGSSDAGCCRRAARGGHVTTIVAGPDVRPGARETRPVDHYGVLATIERALGLPLLARSADPANGTLQALFQRPPRAR
ncbi:MAG: phosphatidylinositol-3-phosphatase, partial [Solirubrobacteraceae bacterium]|nr:phosphatidylinositol-3-phosphatase [Solirubrobacteraceae bacterium]